MRFSSRVSGFAALTVIAGAGLSGTAFAQNPAKYGPGGCGLGSMLIGNKPGFLQVFALTTNVYSLNTFGMTSGTSNCVGTGAKIGYIKQLDYVASNLSSLSREAAQGQGEVLAGFAALMGCDSSVQGQFSTLMQNSFSDVFTQPGSEAILNASLEKVRSDAVLEKACTSI